MPFWSTPSHEAQSAGRNAQDGLDIWEQDRTQAGTCQAQVVWPESQHKARLGFSITELISGGGPFRASKPRTALGLGESLAPCFLGFEVVRDVVQVWKLHPRWFLCWSPLGWVVRGSNPDSRWWNGL